MKTKKGPPHSRPFCIEYGMIHFKSVPETNVPIVCGIFYTIRFLSEFQAIGNRFVNDCLLFQK